MGGEINQICQPGISTYDIAHSPSSSPISFFNTTMYSSSMAVLESAANRGTTGETYTVIAAVVVVQLLL